ncbi:MAG: DUF2791 family P-loop domain-containing protein [Bacillota bacterium]|nr:DUF2791 family P-loop domain-containing protein [Bacillota bacterium]
MIAYDEERLKAVGVVEALRAGVPTRVSTRALPELREDLIEMIQDDLELLREEQGIPGRLIWGRYGQGKTHVLTTVEHLALEMGFAVSRVSLSREVSCHNLGHFYSRVAPLLRTPDSAVYGLQRKLNQKKATDLPESQIMKPGRYSHPLPAIILEDYFYAEGQEQDLLYGYLLGEKVALSELKRIHKVYRGQPMPRFERNFKAGEDATALFGMLADAICFCGCRGWVILIDELELVGRLGKISRLKAYRNLNWLLNWSGTMRYPIYTVAAAAENLRDEMWHPTEVKGVKANMMHDEVVMPELALEKFGETARDEIGKFFEIGTISDRCPIIKPVTEEALVGLLEELVLIHGRAYGWDASLNVGKLLHDLNSPTVRTCIRATLEALDICYLYHEEVIPEAEDLVASTLEEDENFFSDTAEED